MKAIYPAKDFRMLTATGYTSKFISNVFSENSGLAEHLNFDLC